MKKTLALLLALVMVLSVVFVACDQGNDPENPSSSSSTPAPNGGENNDNNENNGNNENNDNNQTPDGDDNNQTPGGDDNNQTPGGDDNNQTPTKPTLDLTLKTEADVKTDTITYYMYKGQSYDTEAEYIAAVKADLPAESTGVDTTTVYDYLSPADYTEIKNTLNTEKVGTAYNMGGAPYAPDPAKDIQLEDCRLMSISIPVYETYSADANGDFIFTLSVFKKNQIATPSAAPVATHKIKISASKYGFTNNQANILKFIDVDLTDYFVYVAADERIAVASPTDTIRPLYLAGTNALKTACKNNDKLVNWFTFAMNVGKSNVSIPEYDNGIVYNFTYKNGGKMTANDYLARFKENDKRTEEKTTVTYVDIDKKAAELKKVYEGLNLSVMGDSISTYGGVTTPGSIWYGGNNIARAGFADEYDTYWGRVLKSFGMEYGVNNAWSGGSFTGGSGDSPYNRVAELSKDGEKPGLILTYFGINNTWGSVGLDTGNLMARLEGKEGEEREQAITEWLADFAFDTYTGGSNNHLPTFDKAYAYMLYRMQSLYPKAQVVCLSLVTNTHSNYGSCATRVPQYNEVIKELCEYFGYVYVDQTAAMNAENADIYTIDGIHPKKNGHEVMYNAVVNAMYADLVAANK